MFIVSKASCILHIHICCNIVYVNIQLMAGPSIWPIFVDETNYYCHIGSNLLIAEKH